MKKLFVGNLPQDATEESVREMFAKFGTERKQLTEQAKKLKAKKDPKLQSRIREIEQRGESPELLTLLASRGPLCRSISHGLGGFS